MGVTAARQAAVEPSVQTRRLAAAGERSDLFLGGGAAFEAWAVVEKGLHPQGRYTDAELASLLDEFASRPIRGHRRA